MSDINAYPIYVQMELDMLKHKYGLDTPAYKEGERTIIYEYLKTCRKPQTCFQCAEALGWSNQRTSAFLHQLYSEGKIDYSRDRKKVKFTVPKTEPIQKPKKVKSTIPSCELPIHDYSGIVLAIGLIILVGLCIYFGFRG